MTIKNTTTQYGAMSKTLHWLIFALFIYQFLTAEIMHALVAGVPESTVYGVGKYAMYGWHKSIGMVLLFLALLRVTWIIYSPAPPLPTTLSKIDKFVATGTKLLLYTIILVMPLSGFVMSMAGGYGITMFGIIPIPNIIGENKALAGIAHEVHEYTAYAIYVVVGLHVLAALIHHYVKKDDILLRMLPTGRK